MLAQAGFRALGRTAALSLMIAAAAPVASAAQARPTLKLSSEVAEIPFRLIDNRVVFSGNVNGSHELVFVLDTGARASGVFGPIGDSLGLAFIGQARVGNGGEGIMAPVAMGAPIQLGRDVIVENEMIVALLEVDLGSRLGFAADGITGAALFTNAIVGLDFDRGVMTVFGELPDIPQNAARIPLTIEDGGVPYAVLDVDLADGTTIEAKVIVDLGQGQSMALNVGSDPGIRLPGDALRADGYATRLDGSEVNGAFGRIARLHLGQYSLPDVVASFPDPDGQIQRAERQGSIGAEILRRFHVVFDYADGFMYLTPNASFDEPFEFDMSGLRLRSAPEFVRIDRVAEGSPGAEAGLMPGDEIIAIDGSAVTGTSLPEIRRLFREHGRTLRVTFRREGTERETSIHLRRRI